MADDLAEEPQQNGENSFQALPIAHESEGGLVLA